MTARHASPAASSGSVAAASGCGREPVTGCGQDAAVTSCGQGVAAGCGQEAPSDCGQETTAGCGQEAATGCGQDAAASSQSSCGAEKTSTCGTVSPFLNCEEMAAWRAFLTASTAVTANLNRELEASVGISMHEYEILVRLSEAENRTLRMSELAEHVSHSRSRLTHTVGRLERDGLVERFSCSSDRRGVNCVLTDKGLAFLRAAAPIHLDGVRRFVIARLNREQLGTFTELMSRLGENTEDC